MKRKIIIATATLLVTVLVWIYAYMKITSPLRPGRMRPGVLSDIGFKYAPPKVTKLSLGMSREQVVNVIEKDGAGIGHQYSKESISYPYMEEPIIGEKTEIIFYNTAEDKSDADISDEQLIPVIIRNGKLIGWGWEFYNSDHIALGMVEKRKKFISGRMAGVEIIEVDKQLEPVLQNIVMKIRILRSDRGKKGVENIQEAAEFLYYNLSMAYPPSLCVSWKEWFFFSGGTTAYSVTDFSSGLAIKKGESIIYFWEKDGNS